MPKSEKHKLLLQKHLDSALVRYTLAEIALGSGVSRDSLNKFQQNGTLGAAKRRELEDWLAQHGYSGSAPIDGGGSAGPIIADLVPTIQTLQSDLPNEIKLDALRELYERLGNRMPFYREWLMGKEEEIDGSKESK